MSKRYHHQMGQQLTESHGPDEELSKLFRDVHFINTELLQIFSQNVRQSCHLHTLHRA
jgi:hypothetical protein